MSGTDPEEKSIFAQRKAILTTIISCFGASDVNKVKKCVVIPHDGTGGKNCVSISGL